LCVFNDEKVLNTRK